MRKPVKRLNSMSFKTKLLLSYILLITIPISISSILIYQRFIVFYTENSSTMVEQRLNQEANNLNTSLKTIELVAFQLASNTSFQNFLNTTYDSYSLDYYNIFTYKILPIFTWVKNANPNISRINVLTFNKTIPEIEIFKPAYKYENEEWFAPLKQIPRDGLVYWETRHLQRDYGTYASSEPPYVYSFFTSVYGVYKSNSTFLELEIKPGVLFNSLNASPVGRSGYIAVLNKSGEIISGKGTPLLSALSTDKGLLSKLDRNEGNYKFDFEKINYSIHFKKLDRLDAYIASIVPTTEITELFYNSVKNYAWTITVTFILLLILAYYMGKLLSRKIHKISTAFHKFQKGDFNTRITVKGFDELDKLGADFNVMASNVKDLIDKVYKAEIAQRQAEFSALQAQINPHFIYNTLESLKMMAELHDEEEISDGLTALGNLIRLNTYKADYMISIGTELENLYDYIKIQNLIRNDRIIVSASVQEEILSCRILGLVLQPMVENSILHGFCNDREYLRIHIKGEKKDGNIEITLEDDGTGIEKNALDRLNHMLGGNVNNEDTGLHHRGIGVVNVDQRIKLHFGQSYGIHIESPAGKGTVIRIVIPAMSCENTSVSADSPETEASGNK